MKLSESLRYSPRLIPPVGKGVDFWIAACVVFMQGVIEIRSLKLC